MGSLKIGTNSITNVKFGNAQVQSVYLGTNLIWTFSAPSYSTELNAIIARASTEGFTLPSSATLTIIDNLISAYKANDDGFGNFLWDLQDRIYNFAYNDAALTNFSRIDWKNPSTSPLITINGGVGYQVEGFVGNGTDGYLDTGFTPSVDGVNYQQLNANRTIFVYTAGASTRLDGSAVTTLNNSFFLGSSVAHRINTTSNFTSGSNFDMTGSGLKSIVASSASIELANRTTIDSRPANINILPSNSQFILRQNTAYGNSIISMYFIGGGVNLGLFSGNNQIEQFRLDYNTYLTAIGLSPNTNP